MANVLDCDQDCSSKAEALVAAGYNAVIRYYSVNAWKRIEPIEAQALSRAGLKIGVVYQDRQNQPADFSEAKGKLAGQNAFLYAQSVIMQPPDSAIYFSADFDPTAQVVTDNIIPFFTGVRTAMSDANGGALPYRVGIYGSGLSCRIVMEAGLAELGWLTQSKGFQEYDVFLKSRNWHLSQQMPATVLGLDCDPDDTNADRPDFGSFILQADHFGPALPTSSRFIVNANTGLRLRGGPGTNFDALRVLPLGTPVTVTGRDGDWAQVNTSGSGNPDGYVLAVFLKAA